MRRIVGIAVVLAGACSGAANHPAHPTTPGALVAPGLRLPDDVVPLAYDLRLDIDPNIELFSGEVAIRVRIARATDHVWLHADRLSIAKASWDGGPLTRVEVKGEQMVVFRFGRVVEPGTITLRFAFTGDTDGDQEGLFRQRDGGWYVFSQGEGVFTRRVTPCFDEPRFKTPWRVTLSVPRQMTALSNMPEEKTIANGGTKEVVFAETPAMSSYLLAVAVGPFTLVDAGTVGRRRIPVRVAVAPSQASRVGVVAARLPAVVDAIERYMDEPLPLRKLDLVVVPAFFGAMENPGLITFDQGIVVGDPKKDSFASYFMYIAAHELAHQWFGNLVTPAWWDHLWLSEAFASWLGDKVVRKLHAYDDPALRFGLARREALDGERARDTKPLWRHVTTTTEADEGFDAIDYSKGQIVLASIEAFVGVDAFRALLRGFVKKHAGGIVTSDDMLASLSRAAGKDVGAALGRYLTLPGTPLVELSLSCEGAPRLVAVARGGAVPLCVAYGSGTSVGRSCALVGAKTELPIGKTCPAWVQSNPDGAYVYTRWLTNGPRGPARPLAQLDPLGRIVAGDDLAAGVYRGNLAAADALRELRAFADAGDPYSELGALAIVRALDPLVDDATRPAWVKWLAARFASRLVLEKKPPVAADNEVVQALLEVVPAEAFAPAVTRRAYTILDKTLPDMTGEMPAALVRLAGLHGGDKLFDRIAARARLLRNEDVRDSWFESLGELGIAQLPKAIDLVTGPEVEAGTAWQALARYHARPPPRTATWHAVQAALPAILRRMSRTEERDVIDALAHLCDKGSRGEVEATFTPHAASIPDGRAHLAATLGAIDSCLARQAHLGDLGAAIAASR